MLPSFALDMAGLELEPGELRADQILEGTPGVFERALWTSADGRHEFGVWEITAGVSTDVEAEEVFVVISGRAQVQVDGGPLLELSPGVVGAFAPGDQTVWRVTETLRKVYTITLP